MAKIFKFSGYLIDPNGDLEADDLRVSLKQDYDAIAHHIHIEEVDLPEWDDDNPLNRCDCPVAECEKYFRKDIKVGDTVRVSNSGEIYSCYSDWIRANIENPFLAAKWAYCRRIENDAIGVVKVIAPHGTQKRDLAYIEVGKVCFIIAVEGLELIKEGQS